MRLEKSPPCLSCDAMDREEPITAESILRRRALNRIPEIPPATFPAPHVATASNINDAIRNHFAQAPDTGVWRRLATFPLKIQKAALAGKRASSRECARGAGACRWNVRSGVMQNLW